MNHPVPETTAQTVAAGPGYWIERFGRDYLISHLPACEPASLLPQLRQWCTRRQAPLDRVFARRLVAEGRDQRPPELIHAGPDAPAVTAPGEATEAGLHYGIDFSAYTVGLFLDQAQNRQRVHAACRPGQRLLNLFAYTCSFSVAAASRGAETLSVDLAKPALERGRGNFRRNAIPIDPTEQAHQPRHRFLADDAFAVLPRLARRGERFDWIILDPPTFSRGKRDSKKKVFRVEADLPELVALCWDVLAPGGRLLVSTNSTALDHPALERLIMHTLEQAAREDGAYQLEPAPTVEDIPPPAPATAWWVARSGGG